MKIGSYNYVGIYKFGDNKSQIQQKSHWENFFLETLTRPFKTILFPAASLFKAPDKASINESKAHLQQMGGKSLTLQSPDKKSLDGMFLKAENFKKELLEYFEFTRDINTDKPCLVLKDEHLIQGKEVLLDSFNHIQPGPARDFCELLNTLHIGLNIAGAHPERQGKGVIIPIKDSYLKLRESSGKPVALICPAEHKSYTDYKASAAGYLMRGVDVMLFDYPGVGHSTGTPSDHNIKLATDTCYQYLQINKGRANEEIIAHGDSTGAAFASDLAARRKGVHVVVEGGFSSYEHIASETRPRFHKIFKRLFPKIANFNNKENLKQVEGHVAIVQVKNTKIAKRHAAKNYKAARKNAQKDQVIKAMKSSFGRKNTKDFDDFLEQADLMPGLF